jgi:hypothetical protein
MVRLFVRIKVGDYETWRKVYDQFYGKRGDMGVVGAAAFSQSRTRTTSPYGTTSSLPKWPELSSRRTLYATSCSMQASRASPRFGSSLRAGGQHRLSHQASS